MSSLHEELFVAHTQVIRNWLDSPAVQEIAINPDGQIWIDTEGEWLCTNTHYPPSQLISWMRSLMTGSESLLSVSRNNLRLSGALFPVSTRGPCLCLRKKLPSQRHTLVHNPSPIIREPQNQKALPSTLEGILKHTLNDPRSTLITGATSSGKTTLLAALLEQTKEERLITVEDTPELNIQHPHWIAFHVKEGYTWEKILSLCLRCRPDRIVIGEVRGSESWELINIYHSGHASGWTSLHASSPQNAMQRLEHLIRSHPSATHIDTLYLRDMICQTFGHIIHCERRGNWRGPTQITALHSINEKGEYLMSTLYHQ